MFELMLFRAVSIVLLIMGNGFFVAAEFALVSVRETRIEQLIAQASPGARAVRRLQREYRGFSARRAAGRNLMQPGVGLDWRAGDRGCF